MDGITSDPRFEDALVLGALLAPDGGAAYRAAMTYWGWADAAATRRDGAAPAAGRPAGAALAGDRPNGAGNIEPIRLLTPKRVANMHPELLGVRFELVLTKPERVFGIEHISRDRLALRVTGRERTVVDMMDRMDLCGGLPIVVAALTVAWPQLDPERFTRQIVRFGGGTVPKRLGFLVERLGLEPADSPLTERWRALIAPGYSVLERGGPNRGGYVRRWMVRVNAALPGD